MPVTGIIRDFCSGADRQGREEKILPDAGYRMMQRWIRQKEIGADMLLSHHPLIFKPVKHVSDEDFIERLVS